MVWALVAILILLIPILAIVIDSQVGQALAERISAGRDRDGEVRSRVEALEGEVRYLSESVESLREESRFLRSLVEGMEREERRLSAGEPPARPGAED